MSVKVKKLITMLLISTMLLMPATFSYVEASNVTIKGHLYDGDTETVYNNGIQNYYIHKDSKGYVLSVNMKDNYKQYSANTLFNALVYKLGQKGQLGLFSNLKSIEDQFVCHYNWAPNKKPWNLEAWRPSGAGFWNKCNPNP